MDDITYNIIHRIRPFCRSASKARKSGGLLNGSPSGLLRSGPRLPVMIEGGKFTLLRPSFWSGTLKQCLDGYRILHLIDQIAMGELCSR